MFEEKKSKKRTISDLNETNGDIDVLTTKELMKELEELEEMMNAAS